MVRRNVFAGPYIDRAAHLRKDAAWLTAALADPTSRVVPIWNSLNLVRDGEAPQAAFWSLREFAAPDRDTADLILLGRLDATHYFAYDFAALEPPQLVPNARFEDLRVNASSLPPEQAGLLSYARAMVAWCRRHRFCGTCGSATLPARGGHARVCTNAACRHEQFPRIDPAIIVLVSDGERALLGRQASWAVGRYSTIAGFVEPGESLEDAVAREVLEETGIEVEEIEYHSSQPWPFPASLMLGFTAHAVTDAVELKDHELEDARWFTRAELASGVPLLPPPQSISYGLIEHWFDSGSEQPLCTLRATPT